MAKKRTRRAGLDASLKMYRRLAIGFVVVVAAILIIVLYVSTVSATIRVTPVQEVLKTEFVVDVVSNPTRDSEVRGRVLSTTIGREKAFQPSGEGKQLVEGRARGTVTIHNESSVAQPLVATTRLWDENKTQFRIQSDVNVPAGGTVQVEAVADEEGAAGDIAPTRLTIPGLNASKQQLIYARNDQPFSGGSSLVAVIGREDIDRAVEELRRELDQEARRMLSEEAGEVFGGASFHAAVLDQAADPGPGAEASSFTVSATVRVIGVFYDDEALRRVALSQLYGTLGQGREFVEVNEGGPQAAVERFSVEEGKANIRVYHDGVAVASTTSDALDPGRFVGMSAEEVERSLIEDGVATQVETTFFPFWVRSVPRLRDHVYVEIE